MLYCHRCWILVMVLIMMSAAAGRRGLIAAFADRRRVGGILGATSALFLLPQHPGAAAAAAAAAATPCRPTRIANGSGSLQTAIRSNSSFRYRSDLTPTRGGGSRSLQLRVSSNQEDASTNEKATVLVEDDEAPVPPATASTEVPPPPTTTPTPGWKKRLRRRTGAALSAVGFLTSATRALLTDRSQFQRAWKPTVDALRSFLRKSGIDLEISALLNVRLLDNILILSRVEKAALNGKDRRDLAVCSRHDVEASSKSHCVRLPTHDEALR